jgi:phage shock protein E
MNWKKLSTTLLLLLTIGFSPLSHAESSAEVAPSVEVKSETVWIDVRSKIENIIDNIDGDPLISHSEIVEGVSAIYPDKNTEIKLYCRRGVRAGRALTALKEAGYTNVSNAGSIDEARKERGITN